MTIPRKRPDRLGAGSVTSRTSRPPGSILFHAAADRPRRAVSAARTGGPFAMKIEDCFEAAREASGYPAWRKLSQSNEIAKMLNDGTVLKDEDRAGLCG